MAITWTNVANLDASLADVPAAAQSTILAFAYAQLAPIRWGAKLDMAATFLAAHMGVLALPGRSSGGTGPVTMERLGDAQVQYAAPFNLDSITSYDLTPWGKIFRTLQRQLPVLAVVG